MKKILSIIALLMLCVSAKAQPIYGTLTITNTPANGYTFTVNGNQFYWTNGAAGGLAMQWTNNFGLDATNLINITGLVLPFQGITASNNVASSNVIVFTGPLSFTASISANWATLTFTTNTSSPYTNVVVPQSAVANAARGPTMSQLAHDLDTYAQYSFLTGDQLHSNYAGLSETNVFTGTNTFANLVGTFGNVTNGNFLNPLFTNGQNFGNAFRSPGLGTGSEQFGLGASALANNATAIGAGAIASNVQSTAIGNGATVGGGSGVALGFQAAVGANGSIAIGPSATTGAGTGATAIGNGANVANTISVAIGRNSATTADHQIMLGTASEYVQMPGSALIAGGLAVTGLQTNISSTGSNILGGMIAFPRTAVTSLASGLNGDIPTGTGMYVVLTGPSAAFTNASFSGGYDGRVIIVRNGTSPSVPMTFVDEFGLGAITNRIWTGQNGPLTLANSNSVATLIYDITAARWIVASHN